jgi:hypothetical protein
MDIFRDNVFILLTAHLLLLVVYVVARRGVFVSLFSGISKRTWLILVLLVLLGGFWRNAEYWMGSHTDGYAAQESARLWKDNSMTGRTCVLGSVKECIFADDQLFPQGLPVLVIWFDLFFGSDSLNASRVSAILSTLNILLIFLCAYLLWKKEDAALYSALVFATMPIVIVSAQTGETRSAGLFFLTLSCFFFLVFLKKGRMVDFFPFALALSYALYVRQESYVVLPVYAFFAWRIIGISRPVKHLSFVIKLASAGVIFILLQLPLLSWLLVSNPYNKMGAGDFFALNFHGFWNQLHWIVAHLFNILPINGTFFHFNIILSIIFFLIAVYSLIRMKGLSMLPIFLFIAYLLVYVLMNDSNISGNNSQTVDYIRRSVMFGLPVSLLVGYAISRFLSKIFPPWAGVGLIMLMVITTSPLAFRAGAVRYDSTALAYSKIIYFPSSLFADARFTKNYDAVIRNDKDLWPLFEKIPANCLIIGRYYLLGLNDAFADKNFSVASLDYLLSGPENSSQRLTLDSALSGSSCVIFVGRKGECELDDANSTAYEPSPVCRYVQKSYYLEFLAENGNMAASYIRNK